MEKFTENSGLGISLEANSGHHYIRSVLPEGPVGRCGKLFSGDELLEVKCHLICPSVAFVAVLLLAFPVLHLGKNTEPNNCPKCVRGVNMCERARLLYGCFQTRQPYRFTKSG